MTVTQTGPEQLRQEFPLPAHQVALRDAHRLVVVHVKERKALLNIDLFHFAETGS